MGLDRCAQISRQIGNVAPSGQNPGGFFMEPDMGEVIQFRPRSAPKREPIDEMFEWWRRYFEAYGIIEPIKTNDKEPA
jgi:hypothetical protein